MSQKFILFLIALVAISVYAAASILAARSPWTHLGSEDYQLIARSGNLPVVFNALQDRDKSKIVEAKKREPGIEERWKDSRPDVVPPLKVRTVLPQNSLADVKANSFDVAFEDEEGQRVGKVTKFIVGGKALLITEPEFSGFQLVPSSDYSKYLIPTSEGLWLVDPEKEGAIKVTKDNFDGTPIDELRGYGKATNKEEGWSLFWNDNPLFNPDGSKIVYVTNRDCLEKGTSMWLLDLATGDEHPLIQNEDGEHYRVVGWADNSHILYGKSVRGSLYAFIADTDGNYSEVDIPPFGVLAQHPGGRVAYTPDYEAAKAIYVVKIDADQNLSNVYKVERSHLSYDSVSFSPDGSKLVYAFAQDDKSPDLNISVVDLGSKREFTLRGALSRGNVLSDIKWLDNGRLLIHIEGTLSNAHERSAWVYSLRASDVK